MADLIKDEGLKFLQDKQFDRAVEEAAKAIEIAPKYGKVYAFRASIYYDTGQYDKAIKDINMLISLEPNNEGHLLYRAIAYLDLGDFQLAIRDLDRAIELNSKYADGYSMRASVYASKFKNYTQAIKDMDRVIELRTKADDYYSRSLYYHMGIDENRRISDLQIAARLGHREAQNILKGKGLGW